LRLAENHPWTRLSRILETGETRIETSDVSLHRVPGGFPVRQGKVCAAPHERAPQAHLTHRGLLRMSTSSTTPNCESRAHDSPALSRGTDETPLNNRSCNAQPSTAPKVPESAEGAWRRVLQVAQLRLRPRQVSVQHTSSPVRTPPRGEQAMLGLSVARARGHVVAPSCMA
jgi:hypothetical protein